MVLAPVSKPSYAVAGKTGSWRVFTPIIDLSKCVKCLNCWVFCPDDAINIDDKGFPHVNYDYCKGCGICSTECPTKAISMKER